MTASVSRHLQLLKDAQLEGGQRSGQLVMYAAVPETLALVTVCLSELSGAAIRDAGV